ncbi:B-cell antigen receptor complex-associated protein beta chain [Diretmus argenteus]
MRWLLVGCCVVALVNLSVAQTVTQRPRFYGVKTGRNLSISCVPSEQSRDRAEWYRAPRYDVAPEQRTHMVDGDRVNINHTARIINASLILRNLTTEDSGVYYCKINNIWGPGTELQVIKPIDLDKAVHRNQMKDGLILFQVVLLALCIAAPLICNRMMLKKEESLYEIPEHDHIYEGLAIETCGDLYEEIPACGQVGAEVPWRQNCD